jgi:hypothetical protein
LVYVAVTDDIDTGWFRTSTPRNEYRVSNSVAAVTDHALSTSFVAAAATVGSAAGNRSAASSATAMTMTSSRDSFPAIWLLTVAHRNNELELPQQMIRNRFPDGTGICPLGPARQQRFAQRRGRSVAGGREESLP